MKKLISEIWQSPNGFLSSVFYCHDIHGHLDESITHTLLSFVQESTPSHKDIDALLQSFEAGRYVPKHPEWADWGINDIELWIRPPIAQPGYVGISADYNEAYSVEHGHPQQFTYAQFRVAMNHWRVFQELVAKQGKENLVGQRFEVAWPEA
jgi:hypothetical protein